MRTNIFRSIRMGKEVFHPRSYDEDSFVMDWSMEAGGMVPPHMHRYMDEHFTVIQGEILFTVGKEKIRKRAGEVLLVPKGTTHSIKNITKGKIGLSVKYSPCADTHRMFEIVATLDEANPGSTMNIIKYFYLAPKLGLRAFSEPQPPFANSIMTAMVNIMGKLSAWDRLLPLFKLT